MSNFDKMPKGMTPNLPLWSFQLQANSKLVLKTRKDLEIHLITRALKDEEFKRELIANPKAVIESELGSKLPDELEINVLEETEDTIYMVLPCNPYEGLSEEELQATLGITYEDVAQWVLEQQRNLVLDEDKSIEIIGQAWNDQVLKHKLLFHTKQTLEEIWETRMPENINIKLFEESRLAIYLVLPLLRDVNLLEEADNIINSRPEFSLVNDGNAYLLNIGASPSVVITSQCGGSGCCPTNS